jgi:hypothetical protein
MQKLYYHATDREFERFSRSYMASKGASNGHLGIWVGNERSDCEEYGNVLMTLSVPDYVPYALSYRELKAMHDHVRDMDDDEAGGYYRDFSRRLLDEGYTVIDIIEERTKPSHSILLDVENIVIKECEVLACRPSRWETP